MLPITVRLQSMERACSACENARTLARSGGCEYGVRMLTIELDREEDGRWIGEIPELPGVLAYGATDAEARINVTVLALRVLADRLEHGEAVPFNPRDFFVGA